MPVSRTSSAETPILRRSRTLLTRNPARPVIDNGAILEANGMICAVGKYGELSQTHHARLVDEGETVLLPGLINAHTHTELSHLRDRIQPGGGFEDWVAQLLALPARDLDTKAVSKAIDEMAAGQICAVGDISGNNPQAMASLWRQSDLHALLWVEQIGFAPLPQGQPRGLPDAGATPKLRVAPAGHALYSTSPETLRQTKAWCRSHELPFSLHLAEHSGEIEFLTTGRGPFGAMLTKRLVPKSFSPPGLHPVAYADSLGLLDSSTLVVHAVHLDPGHPHLLAHRGSTVCLCPRSNDFIGVGRALWEDLDAAGVPLCLGTDSLASNWDLDLWQEAWYIAQHWSGTLTLDKLVSFMTTTPARILGLPRLGRLAPGKRAVYARLSLEKANRLPLA